MLNKKVCIGLLMLLVVVVLMTGCASKTVVGTWKGTLVSAIISKDGSVSGTLFSGYYGLRLCKSEFNDHAITLYFASEADTSNEVVSKDVYEYRLEGNGNTLTILSCTKISYNNGEETWRNVDTSGWDWVLTRKN